MIKSLGLHHILLTEEESRCFWVAREYQRKTLRRRLFVGGGYLWADWKSLEWSKNPLVLLVQCLAFMLLAPLFLLQLLLKKVIQALLFPFEYGKTYCVPASLAAPGEKTLAGLHHAFAPHVPMGMREYVSCLTDWISILYGPQAAQQFNVKHYLQAHALESAGTIEMNPALRTMVTVARDQLSKELGHYGVAQKQLH